MDMVGEKLGMDIVNCGKFGSTVSMGDKIISRHIKDISEIHYTKTLFCADGCAIRNPDSCLKNVYLCYTMMTSRTYHSLHLDIVSFDSSSIIYVLLPHRLPAEELTAIEELSTRFETNIVAISEMDWNNDMTPLSFHVSRNR